MNNKKLIGQRINEALALTGKKQKDLAKALNVTDNTISYFCSGSRTPNTMQIIEISIFFNVSADYLLGLTNIKTLDTNIKSVCNYTGLTEQSLSNLQMCHKNTKSIDAINFFMSNEHFLSFIHQLAKCKCISEIKIKDFFNSITSHSSINAMLNDKESLYAVCSKYLNDNQDLNQYKLNKIFIKILDNISRQQNISIESIVNDLYDANADIDLQNYIDDLMYFHRCELQNFKEDTEDANIYFDEECTALTEDEASKRDEQAASYEGGTEITPYITQKVNSDLKKYFGTLDDNSKENIDDGKHNTEKK